MRANERVDAGQGLRPEARAVEYPEMADAWLQPVRPAMLGNVDAQIMRGFGLAGAGYVVMLALDCHQGDAFDLTRVYSIAAVRHPAGRQSATNKHSVDGLQVELGGEIHHRKVLIIEAAMGRREIAVALDQMHVQIAMGRNMPSMFIDMKPFRWRKPG